MHGQRGVCAHPCALCPAPRHGWVPAPAALVPLRLPRAEKTPLHLLSVIASAWLKEDGGGPRPHRHSDLMLVVRGRGRDRCPGAQEAKRPVHSHTRPGPPRLASGRLSASTRAV